MAKEVGAAYVSIYANMKNFSKGVEKGVSSATVAIGNLMSEAVSGAAEFIGSGLEKGIKRLDTIQNFPKLMSEFGYSAKEAEGYVKQVADHLVGLPGSTDEVLSLVQALSDSTSSLGLATSTGIAFNDMLTAAGADAATTTLAMRTFDQIMGGGTVTAQRWQSLTSKMPKQFNMLAENILGAGASSVQLGEALQGGEVTLEQLAQAMTDLGPQFENQARAMSNGIGTALENIPNRLAAGWESVLNVFGQENIANVINQFSTGVKNGMQAFAGILSDSLGRIKTAFDNSGIADKVGSIVSKAKAALENAGIGNILENGVSGALDIVGRALGWLDENFGRISEAVGGIAEVAMGFLGRIADSGILESIGELVAHVFDIISYNLPDIEWLGNLLIDIVDGALSWIASNQGLIITALSGIAGAFAAIMGFKIGGEIVKFITGIQGVIKLFAANPMMIVVLAIAGVVTALTAFFTQTETGRKLWSDFTSALGQFIEDARPVVEGAINAVSEVVKGFLEWVATDGAAIFTAIADTIGGVLEFIVGLFTGNEDQISHGWETFLNGLGTLVDGALGVIEDTFTNILAGIVSLFGVDFEEAKAIVTNVFDTIKRVTKIAWKAIEKFIQDPIGTIKKVVEKVFDGIKTFITNILTRVKNTVSTIWNGIKSAITIAVNAIKTTVGNVFNAVKTTVGNIFDGIKTTASNIWNGIKTAISNVINGIKTTIENIFNAIKNFLSNLFGGIKTTTSNAWNGVKNIIGGVVNGVKTVVTNVFNGVKNTVGSIFGGIKSTASNIWNGIKSTVGNAAKGLKDGVTNTLNGLKNGAKGIWEGMKGAASSIFGGIKNVIGKAMDAAKGVVQNEAKKMQSAINGINGKTVNLNANDNISGACSKAQKSINGLYGKTVSVNFNAYQTGLKAIEVQERVFADTRRIEVIPTFVASGGIATKPTLSIWGEAGSEAIIPLSNRSKVRPFARAVAAEMGAGGGVTVTGNTFIVRDDSDIDRIADRINEKVNRARAGALR